MESESQTAAKPSELNTLLGLLADIRAAVGDPTGKLMQDELLDKCRAIKRVGDEMARICDVPVSAPVKEWATDTEINAAVNEWRSFWPNA
tara:strand:- start:711 stop:980 length:270 start_codon:yes stop_codon:yes gene_type:complete